ncbi:MAG: hypothetical protein ACYTG0_12690 [Planctomycetota bacterium]|jgi:hypothetical protein
MAMIPEHVRAALKDPAALFRRIMGKLDDLYLPTPQEAMAQRAMRPIRTETRSAPISSTVSDDQAAGAISVWKSPKLDTKGYTLQNAFVAVQVLGDTNVDIGLTMFGVLEGSCGSVQCELARSLAVPYAGPGYYALSAMTNADSLAATIQFRLVAFSAQAAAGRQLRFRLDGMLVAGHRF